MSFSFTVCNVEFLLLQVSSIILSTLSCCFTNTVLDFSFTIPALCFAIFSIVSPRTSTWSYPILAITDIIESAIFVQSVVPP